MDDAKNVLGETNERWMQLGEHKIRVELARVRTLFVAKLDPDCTNSVSERNAES